MIDERNAIVTPHVGADDTVISHGLIRWYIAQVAQNKLLNNVLVNLFSAEGSEAYLNPASDYLKLERGSRKGHSVIGFRRVHGDPEIEGALKGGIYLSAESASPFP
jgi:ion channel POLLUX/CASTOR